MSSGPPNKCRLSCQRIVLEGIVVSLCHAACQAASQPGLVGALGLLSDLLSVRQGLPVNLFFFVLASTSAPS